MGYRLVFLYADFSSIESRNVVIYTGVKRSLRQQPGLKRE